MCNHNNIVGDNYGQTCQDCGAVLAGYGYWGSAATCQHQWTRDADGDGQTCLYCERWEPLTPENAPDAFPERKAASFRTEYKGFTIQAYDSLIEGQSWVGELILGTTLVWSIGGHANSAAAAAAIEREIDRRRLQAERTEIYNRLTDNGAHELPF